MIFVTGDTHGDFSERFSKKYFPEQKELTRDDIIIVCGDFGIWHDNPQERYWLDWLAGKSFTICFCDGNHENFDRLYSDEFKIVNFYSGSAHKIRDNIYHLMRGEIYDFEGKKFFVMGGASSHDIQDGILDLENFTSEQAFQDTYNRMCRENKMFRVNHYSWWEEELPSDEEIDRAKINLTKSGNKVDYIISHSAPTSIVKNVLGYKEHDAATDFLQYVKRTCEFTHWYFGHYHRDFAIDDRFTAVYRKIIRLEEQR